MTIFFGPEDKVKQNDSNQTNRVKTTK